MRDDFEEPPAEKGREWDVAHELAWDEFLAALGQASRPSDEVLVKAISYVKWFPHLYEMSCVYEDLRKDCRDSLRNAQINAVQLLMRELERFGLRSGPLWKSSELCWSLFRFREKELGLCAGLDCWPECLGPVVFKLRPEEQDDIRDGAAILMEFVARLGIEEESITPPADPRATTESGVSVDVETWTVRIGERAFQLNSEQQARWLSVLASNRGKLISGPQLEQHDNQLMDVRPDRLKRSLPPEVLALLETVPKKGTRMKLA